MPNKRPTVYVVDDDPAMRDSLRWLIESVDLNVETYDSAHAFLQNYDPSQPGCIVLDVRMPGMSGLEVQEKIASHTLRNPIIIITGYGDVPMAVKAIKSGAVDFIEKPFSDQVLLDRIHSALEIDENDRGHMEMNADLKQRYARLTPREREVMHWVVEGLSNKQIAAQLGISEKTIEAHRARVMDKMEAGSLAELVRMSVVCEPVDE